jgi:hypothetical protein
MGTGCACCADLLRGGLGRRRLLGFGAAVGLAAMLPRPGAAAEGNYDAMLLACIDPRFPEPNLNYMRGRGMAGKYSQFIFAGAAIGVVAPAFAAWHATFWENLAASVELHRIARVIAIDHRDCGAAKIAYGADKVASPAAETAVHKEALAAFRAEMGRRQPALQVETGLMALDGTVEMLG